MFANLLVSNNGPHPPSTLARQTAKHLVDIIIIELTADGFVTYQQEKNDLEVRLAQELTLHHDNLRSTEQEQIVRIGDRRMTEPFSKELIKDAFNAVYKITQGSIFADHFRKLEVLEFVRNTLITHFSTAVHIERSYHADRNSQSAGAIAFRALHHHGHRRS